MKKIIAGLLAGISLLSVVATSAFAEGFCKCNPCKCVKCECAKK